MKLQRCKCALPGHHHEEGSACQRIYFPQDPIWTCKAAAHAHGGPLMLMRSGGPVPSKFGCPWCDCPQINSIPPEPAPIHSPTRGVGGDPEQEELRLALAQQERNESV